MFKKREKLQLFMFNTFLNIENPEENRNEYLPNLGMKKNFLSVNFPEKKIQLQAF